MRHTSLLFSPRPLVAIATASVASVALAACGGAARSGPTASAGAGVRFSSCARAHGLSDYPDPRAGDDDQIVPVTKGLSESPTVVKAALRTCEKQDPGPSPTAGQPKYTASEMNEIRTGMLAMARCMRGHGVYYPDPGVSAGPGGRGFEYGWSARQLRGHPIDYRSPGFTTADHACAHLLTGAIPGRRS